MSVTLLLGAQWGDEGKGKVLDYLVGHYKIGIVARSQGGNNAGHTVVINSHEYDFHLLPTGMATKECINIIGNGVVVNLDALFAEIEKNGFVFGNEENEKNRRLYISDCAHLVLPVHIEADGYQESLLEEKAKLGTTKRGIGPTYSSKCFRIGVRLGDLLNDPQNFEKRYREQVQFYSKIFASINANVENDLKQFKELAFKIKKLGLVCNTTMLLHKYRQEGRPILVEGANGTLLDIDFGTYPFVTSSNSTAGGACTGLGIPPTSITRVVGIFKAYQTRVGAGPFPTELLNNEGKPSKEGERLQQIGAEFGVTTGRKRRCGWLDLVLLRYSCIINGFTSLAVTKVDVLDTFEEIKIGIAYNLDGEELLHPPATINDWYKIKVEYKTFPGWMSNTSKARTFDQLPQACKDYLLFIEQHIKIPIEFIGVGKSRDALILLIKRMSWKNTDPLELWKTSTTLPISHNKIKELNEQDKSQPAPPPPVRIRFWMSINQIDSKKKTEYFWKLIRAWPDEWEKRAVLWSKSGISITNTLTAFYIATKITADVFLMDPKLKFFQILRQLSTFNLSVKAISISLGMGMLVPLFSVPPVANSAKFSFSFGICLSFLFLLNHRQKLGMRKLPEGTVLDLFAQTFECTRSVWRKLPLIAGVNIAAAGVVVCAMAWARDRNLNKIFVNCDFVTFFFRIHSKMDIDPDLINELVTNSEYYQNQKRGVIGKKIYSITAWLTSPKILNFFERRRVSAPDSPLDL
ncbi:Adenylosuccinate synthetase [Meloidogyne graminicola]|uniref:Adenylosuccinate synthetase n=1 Tax=Meloidogyne graminicola TaxID=189291 RepID=A0A8T0A3T6_9BILA|nr:Adenylosuccinate synthetase [Meloidogyne graminicola]